jgi:hypothetical protein
MELEPLTERPARRRVQLFLEGSKTYPVPETEVDDFLARKPAPKKEQAPSPTTYLDALPTGLYQLPSQPAFVARLKKYKEDPPLTCKKDDYTLFTHQKILLDYLNISTPYRGLLVYHGLGSGKTCSSIAVAEGFVHNAGMKVWVFTPKFLEAGYRADMLKCSDTYRRAQHWAFANGKWQNDEAEPNYESLSPKEKAAVDKHLEAQINANFSFVHYNGLDCMNFKDKFQGGNPFDTTVVVIDEVHNLVSRISGASKESPFAQMYEWLLSAKNCRVVALSGSPLVNDPREFGILYNLIRGYMPVWRVKISRPVTLADLGPVAPSIAHFSATELEMVVSRVPLGFAAEYADGVLIGVKRGESLPDEEITYELRKFGETRLEMQKLLPDVSFDVSRDVFVRRIAGLTSYFPDATDLMPVLHPRQEHLVEMTGYQLKRHQEAREKEGPAKMQASVPDDFRAASRGVCNFAFPENVSRPVQKIEVCDIEGDSTPAYAALADTAVAQMRACFTLEKMREQYSPKFAAVLDRIKELKDAKQLLFSNLYLEGLRFFCEALNANGYERLVLNPTANSGWEVHSLHDEWPKYITYTGSDREKEMYLNVFNENWDAVPQALHATLQKFHTKLFFITPVGVEGIALSNVTHVHLLDPHWHPARFVQAVGRARRLCKHSSDVKEGVTPHVYLMSSKDPTTDQYLYKHSKKKEEESQQWLDAIRQASIENPVRQKRVIQYKGTPRTLWYNSSEVRPKLFKSDKGEAAYGYGSFSQEGGKLRLQTYDLAGKPTKLATFFL